ncbi:hypothetical protein KVP08_023615 (plasmid) [Shewanella putrefaciens]|nr:hypothetical protein KVP08_023615 [Shewanella putrefaciens]
MTATFCPPSRQGELDLFAEQPSDVPDEIDTPVNDIESHAQYTDTTETQQKINSRTLVFIRQRLILI